MRQTAIWLTTALALIGMNWRSPALSQEAPGREGGSVLFGAFVTDRDTSTRFDSEFGEGTNLDLEDDLGLESSMSVARVGGYYWLAPRHRLDGAYFDLSRTATKPIQETIEFGRRTFTIDTLIESESDLSILKVDYTYVALPREHGFLGVTGGLYVARAKLSLREATLGSAESQGLTAPLPLVGVRGEYAFGDRFTLRGAAQWFVLRTDDTRGTLRDFYVGADYGFGKRMAVGLAYNAVTMSVEAEERLFRGSVDWGYDGLLLYFKLDLGARATR